MDHLRRRLRAWSRGWPHKVPCQKLKYKLSPEAGAQKGIVLFTLVIDKLDPLFYLRAFDFLAKSRSHKPRNQRFAGSWL